VMGVYKLDRDRPDVTQLWGSALMPLGPKPAGWWGFTNSTVIDQM
jgi:hypothetical protein